MNIAICCLFAIESGDFYQRKSLLTWCFFFRISLSCFGGSLIDKGASEVIEIGIVLDTIPNPTISKNLFVNTRMLDGNNEFSFDLIGLLSEKEYYCRAYEMNAQGTGYGNEITFTSTFDNYNNLSVTLNNQEEVDEFGTHQYTGIAGLTIIGAVNDLTQFTNGRTDAKN